MVRVVFGCVFLARVLLAQNSPDPAMLRADRAFVTAMAKPDRLALEKLLDADFTWTDFEGRSQTRTDVLRDLPHPAIVNESGAQIERYGYGELGDVQVNRGQAHVLRVWVKRAGVWKAIAYQEVMSRTEPPVFTPGAGKDCENPCRSIPFQPKNETEMQVSAAYSKLETAANARNSAAFAVMAAEEFVAASSNSDKTAGKRERMDDFDHAKNGGVAPTPLVFARMFDFGNAVLMKSEHVPDRGKPLHVTRVWVRRDGSWVETLSYQTSEQAAP
jgi:hypothetical protein